MHFLRCTIQKLNCHNKIHPSIQIPWKLLWQNRRVDFTLTNHCINPYLYFLSASTYTYTGSARCCRMAGSGALCQGNRGIMGQGPVMPRKSLDIRTTDYPCHREKGSTALFPASGEDRSGQGPAKGSRDWSLVGSGARPQGLKPPVHAASSLRPGLSFCLVSRRMPGHYPYFCFCSIFIVGHVSEILFVGGFNDGQTFIA